VATNYRTLFLPALFAALLAAQAPRLRIAAVRWLIWAAGFAAPLLGIEALHRAIAAAAGAEFPGGTYAGQLRELLGYHGGQGFRFAGWAAFPAHVLRWEGAASLVLLAAVLPFQFRRWRSADLESAVLLLGPWALFSAYWDNAPRFFAILLPWVAAVKGRWLLAAGAAFADRLRLPAAAVWAPVLAATVVALPRAAAIVPRTTPYHEAARFLAVTGDPRHCSTNARLGDACFFPGAAAPVPPGDRDLAAAVRAGRRWLVTDLQMSFGGFDRPGERIATAERAVAGRRPVFEASYDPEALARFVLEQDLTFREAREVLRHLEAAAPRLKIWDLAAAR
jgi:hypothetical protein